MMLMHRDGASSREIGEALGLNHNTILNWLDDAGLTPNGGNGARKSRRRILPDAAAAAATEAQRALAKLSLVPSADEVPDAVATLRLQQSIARELVQLHFERVQKGTTTVEHVAKAMSLEERIATRIHELTPREPIDPEIDPTNLEAAAEVRAKLLRLVEAAERTFACGACGKGPYGKKGEPCSK
jgi:hypothetical protein